MLSVPTTSPAHTRHCPVFMSVWGERNATETHAAQRAERTGQGKTWSGVAATSAAHIQGRVLSSAMYASLVMHTIAH